MDFKGSNVLSVRQFTLENLETVFNVANRMEKFASRQAQTKVLEGAILANLFFEPSTRTRISFGCAFNRLGGYVNDTVGFEFSSIVKGESLSDTSRVLSGYSDIIVVRHPTKGSVAKFAEATNVPIINGGDGIGEHPTQALLDIYTVYKEIGSDFQKINGLSIALVGDLKNGRTVHSLARLLSLFKNITFYLVAPPELGMPDSVLDTIASHGHRVIITSDLKEGIADADVVYTTRIQEERFESEEEYKKYRGFFKLSREFYERESKKRATIMHPLPRDSREIYCELDTDLNGHPNMAIFRQTDNGIPVRMALFALILGVEDKVEEYEKKVIWYVPDSFGKF